jgi:23S rRNA (uracil1939-C5)-methyltransferase
VFIPYTLAGETVAAHRTGKRGEAAVAALDRVEIASPERVVPPCPHFGTCGGCALQHWEAAAALAWKAGLVRQTLARAGFALPATIPVIAAGADRRRADFALRPGVLGLHRAGSREVVDLRTCPLVHPDIAAILPALRAITRRQDLLRREGSAVINRVDNGLDILLRTDQEPSLPARQALVALARPELVARLSWASPRGTAEAVAQHRQPMLGFGALAVSPPAGAFLQPTAAGEAAIRAAITAAVRGAKRAKRIVELYAGVGSLTAALWGHGKLVVYEGDAPAMAALRRGVRGINAITRDLARQPLTAKELAGDIVVLDPPYGGAAAQMPALAAAKVPVVIYVSCNQAALAKDAAVLARAGYGLRALTIIDQFRWGADVESVAVFGL